MPPTGESAQRLLMAQLSSIDWPAWVQAVGSVLAIAAAIWIDHGEARRARRERTARISEAHRVRVTAIQHSAAVCARSTECLVAMFDRRIEGRILAPYEGFHAALGLLSLYASTSGDLEPHIVTAVLEAEGEMKDLANYLEKAGPPFEDENLAAIISSFTLTTARLKDIPARYAAAPDLAASRAVTARS